jgi:hypothetical protein
MQTCRSKNVLYAQTRLTIWSASKRYGPSSYMLCLKLSALVTLPAETCLQAFCTTILLSALPLSFPFLTGPRVGKLCIPFVLCTAGHASCDHYMQRAYTKKNFSNSNSRFLFSLETTVRSHVRVLVTTVVTVPVPWPRSVPFVTPATKQRGHDCDFA